MWGLLWGVRCDFAEKFRVGKLRDERCEGPRTITRPKPRDAFLHAKPWQFGRDGRKFKVVSERLRRLSRVLARFDHSGDCRSVFPSVETILGRLHAAELNYPETGPAWRSRMDWSRRTVFVYLERLERAGIATSGGLSSYHGTKRRELHSERLLSVPLESCTPTLRESCIGSKSLDSKKWHVSRKKRAETPRPETGRRASPPSDSTSPSKATSTATSKPKPSCGGKAKTQTQTVAGPLPSVPVSDLRKPSAAVQLLNLLAQTYGVEKDADLFPMMMLTYVLRSIRRDPGGQRLVFDPGAYVISCTENFLRSRRIIRATRFLSDSRICPACTSMARSGLKEMHPPRNQHQHAGDVAVNPSRGINSTRRQDRKSRQPTARDAAERKAGTREPRSIRSASRDLTAMRSKLRTRKPQDARNRRAMTTNTLPNRRHARKSRRSLVGRGDSASVSRFSIPMVAKVPCGRLETMSPRS